MGCDIHLYKEKQIDGRWVTADTWVDEYGDGADVPWKMRFTDRNYYLFGILARALERLVIFHSSLAEFHLMFQMKFLRHPIHGVKMVIIIPICISMN